ncbi:Short-chain alcohol dehydrogenase [Yersinia mollaretii ATCC 43969]|uniref:Short-chain alcohol dehydrogenase n=1 Tax=Yersinia mollaretii (strain ATCC 43969 / DSM 18520 / CIP 103324 / CNY 7263 / WAIP 204) TaxID=349967 RepID=A0ABP2EJW1_YERMW|nr:SDR family oxidoreductase [Yersinia mollaretii]EEQ12389.1 Short-chain alcohol dehydrogenase [Yersinia mollaretii ATCC 43969]QKJ03473.1 SDR family oxidoreductase [Yersinia mollaretii ATCC 43969]
MRKLAVITGATGGLGRELTRKFWDAGYSLILVSRRADELNSLFRTLADKVNQSVHCATTDLSNPLQLSLLSDLLTKKQPNVLINNAAIQGPIGPSWENDMTEIQSTIQVNLLAPIELCRAVVSGMIVNGGGAIINISGGGATAPRANFTSYATAKAGLIRYSETLAVETTAYGIKVNCIAPGAMRTGMLGEILKCGAKVAGEREFTMANKVFAEGGASMESVAQLALFLTSEASNGITGKLVSAVWDDWPHWTEHLDELSSSDVYTLRRITGRDRGFTWGDK